METQNHSTKIKYSKCIVLLVLILNIVFAACVFTVLFCGFEEPEALIIAWYAFTGTELLSLAGIKISDNKYADKVNIKADDSNEEEEIIEDQEIN